ncbi:Sm-like protein LSM2 SCDLUD_001600 [Saccharomycodes ludwigii]|uniref:Sm-like protein LSM2 n=1 Tax=Saccharomycodes ludwigii TaxID=36035 RepID=UPI001E83A2EC|nr:hypothetical protein SCDLUD_001600 [Saccharomycodes ludwigii]KAH3901818.1 hypothetical protein SCDLUD_001600 [Saccharomycodes ludwigii]
MLFFSLFKTLVDQEVVVELKNGVEIKGVLKSVDQFLNLKLDNLQETSVFKQLPHLYAVRNIFIRGSNIRYVYLKKNMIDTNLLQDATRREAISEKNK